MLITNEVFNDFLKCKYKTYQKLQGKQETKSDYELLQIELEENYKKQFLERINLPDEINNFTYPISLTIDDLKKGSSLITDISVNFDDAVLSIDAIEKVAGKSKLGSFFYIPIYLNKVNKISKNHKLLLTLSSLILGQMQGKVPEYGKIILGKEFKTSKIAINVFLPQVKATLDEIRKLDLNLELKFSIADRCRECELCKADAREKDSLSLLKGMPTKEIIKYNNKGIFTVTQLSYTFRARKRSKRMPPRRNSLFTLKALAIREKKIYVFENPQLPEYQVQIYLDIEGNEQNTFHYLIGLLVVENGLEKRFSFWANNPSEEENILKQFLEICSQYQNFTLFHYGSYEKQYLQRVKKKFSEKYDETIDKILQNAINILSIIYLNIYFPTYSNELKEIAGYLGIQWTDKNASGIQSLVWRARWEMAQNEELKYKLIQYNLEDCLALKIVTDTIYNFIEKVNNDVAYVTDIKRKSIYNFDENYASEDIKIINKSSFFDYQREKVYVRTIKKKNKYRNNNLVSSHLNKFSKIVSYAISECRFCKTNNFSKISEITKTFIDLKFFNKGIRRLRIKYVGGKFQCLQCRRTHFTWEFNQVKARYGHNIKSWVIYQHIVYRLSFLQIQESLRDVFGLLIDEGTLRRFKAYGEKIYGETYEQILKNIIIAKVIYIDETPIDMRDESGYFWILATDDSVFSLYKSTREGEFLKELLKDFKGILVSDFYAAYDSLDCVQQKCLIHLIRDFNDDLLKNPFDQEFKAISSGFTALLKNIVATIDKYGLKKRHLYKHKKEVAHFYKAYIINKKYNSEVAVKYQKKFDKYQNKLFTFLDFDGVSWNNTNAEHAIKILALHRNKNASSFKKVRINEYAILISIYQTCLYRKINFLQFLLSGEKDIDKFS